MKRAIEEKDSEKLRLLQNELLERETETITNVGVNLIDLRGFNDRIRSRNELDVISLTEDDLALLLANLNSSQVS